MLTPPDAAASLVQTPPKYKMAIVVWIAVYATALPLIATLKPMTVSLPPSVPAILAAISPVSTTVGSAFQALTWLF